MSLISLQISGYTYGTSAVAKSPVSLAGFELMQQSALFGEEDVKYSRLSHDVVKDQVEVILDAWYGFVGSQPHLLQSFLGKSDGKPLGDYLGGVRKRFGQWILDTARAERPEVARLST
ncbi:MAG: protoglobin domain-containing protein [Nitrospira sp.]